MPIDCPHWRDCGIKGGGCCAIARHDRPSFGTCERCIASGESVPGGRAPPPLTAAVVAHAAAGIARALTGTGGASEELVKARTEVCVRCPHAELTAGVLRRCSLCGCSTWAKVRNAGEKCPAGKW